MALKGVQCHCHVGLPLRLLVTDFDFADYAVILAETLEVLLGLSVSWTKTKEFGDFVVQSDGGSNREVTRRLGLAYGVMDSRNMGIWRRRYLTRRTKIMLLRALVIPVLLYGCETWTLNIVLKARLDSFGTEHLCR
ncbi:uncharacterized protein LOC119587867 [Penaeus monodon]|uniref:uncharacterized protein LOC119587867 n=1 Tax=Penaeus monodon TaxID=6687 RepID=UPI0018A72E74|nr:uncharacterized protein LOC119587867 [Penaeus monodon]